MHERQDHQDGSTVPTQGLREAAFAQISSNGFGDRSNSYAHAMAWFGGCLYVGTTRLNLCLIKVQSSYAQLPFQVWPTDCPDSRDELYDLDLRAQIWRYDPQAGTWTQVLRAPLVEGENGDWVPREIGYRAMVVHQASPGEPAALYVSAWAPGRAPGGHILRTVDGVTFQRVTRYGILDTPISSTRALIRFKGRLFFSPTGQRGSAGGQQNTAGLPVIYESRDPAREAWRPVCAPGFGNSRNLGIFSVCATAQRLYAGTFNLDGFEVWTSRCEGTPPYTWHKLVDAGAGRGSLNQVPVSMCAFRGAVYIGSGIQGGGRDRVNGIGPAAAELVRINPDSSWEVVVGEPRTASGAPRVARSGLSAGFGNFFSGYIWTLAEHNGWLYAGTFDWSVTLRWLSPEQALSNVQRFLDKVDVEDIISHQGGFELWRSFDGDNWLPVTRTGFGNPYNWGVRNLLSTPHGLFLGTANVFGPRVAVRRGTAWVYEDNARGGLEVWHAP